jgi:hypothetical protein
MAVTIANIETTSRLRLGEVTASFWTSAELVEIIIAGVRDLWRDVVDLKQEHYLTVDATNVSLAASTATLSGVPADVHKVYLIEPRDLTSTSSHQSLIFKPLDYNHPRFQAARASDNVSPDNEVIYYAITGQGSPVAAPVIYVAPKVTSAVLLSFIYVPTLSSSIASGSTVPIPGEADNALVAWTVAFARAKEREDRGPDPGWLAIYATEKQHLLESLGLRQLQEPTFVDAIFEDYTS